MDNQDLNLDNLDEQFEDELEDAEQDDIVDIDTDEEESSESGNRGNLAKALQAERREKRELKDRLSQLESEQKRANALLERMGQPQQHQRVDVDQHRAQLQTWMLERPDEFIASIQQQTQKSLMGQFAPVMTMQAERIIHATPEYREAYEIPEIKEIVDNFVANEISTGGIENIQDMKEVLGNVMKAVQVIRGTSGVQQPKNPARDKMTSIAQKSGSSGRKSGEQRMQELQNLARTNPKKYVEELKKPEVRQFVNETVFARKRTPT